MTKKIPDMAVKAPIVTGPKTVGSVYVWHGKDSQESAQLLAKELGGQAGTLPPSGFEGHLVCLSPAVSNKFKWGDRKFATIINDPRTKYKEALEEHQEILATKARVYCITSIGKGRRVFFNVGDQTTEVTHKAVLAKFRAHVAALGNPNLVAFDGLKYGLTFLPDKVIFTPSLLNVPLVRDALKNIVPVKKAKELLQELIGSSSDEEASALHTLLVRLKAKPSLVEKVAEA